MNGFLVRCAALLCVVACASGADVPTPAEPAGYAQWLEEHSMLHQAEALARRYSGTSDQWQRAYGVPQPRAASARASVWFTAYPASTIAASPGASVLATLADDRLWQAFQPIGIQAVHT